MTDIEILQEEAERGVRLRADQILDIWLEKAGGRTLGVSAAPQDGWLMHTYMYLRNQLFPHIPGPSDEEIFRTGRNSLLDFMRHAYEYERMHCGFDPKRDFCLLSGQETTENGFIPEYLRMKELIREMHVYEFMRIGADITPFNTVGHIGGVHYVAMYVAKQLYASGVPVDLGLVSAAAASHDIGKYGCRENEERRVPYLHYYYTDYCLRRLGLGQIAHTAANHSTWDLELEDLSAESLILIYADFRTKSTRENGEEIIHFYSLAQAFDVILSKLDNVDEAKRLRYIRVYKKLKDFEDYMIEHGVHTEIDDLGDSYPEDCPLPVKPLHRELVLLDRRNVTEQVKFRAIDHNIRVMNRFGNERQFASLIESARSETNWKNIRTYISIFKEYSTYMTDSQKSAVLRFLYDMLGHHESDIREQTALVMGYIVAKYREEYKKELPQDVPAQDDNVSNLSMFREYISLLLEPDRKYTDIHRKWITASTDFFVCSVTENCRPSCRHRYYDILQEYYKPEYYLKETHAQGNSREETEEKIIVLMITALRMDAAFCTESFRSVLAAFADEVMGKHSVSVDLITLEVLAHYGFIEPDERDARRRELLGLGSGHLTDEQRSSMFLDDLKLHVTWNIKMANIAILKQEAESSPDKNLLMQIATHFSNLIKVSETVTVRRAAGNCLLDIIGGMAKDQVNELMIELHNGLELSDYQFSGLIPDYLGLVLLHLDLNEFDEVIYELGKMIDSGNDRSAEAAINTIAVTLEHFGTGDTERMNHMLGLLIKGAAYYRAEISREAVRAIGEHIFASKILSVEEKRTIASHCFKRLLTLMPEAADSDEIDFYNNAAALNHVYRYITAFRTEIGMPDFAPEKPAVFFPGTFDPFSLGHKAIATTIRDMGFDVYLAIDEFSWSKKTLPHMLRKKILQMSVADEEGLYLFPDDIPVNIANTADLRKLKDLFTGQELYIAVGSDVVLNASAYRKKPEPDSIHTFNHIVFAREARKLDADGEIFPISGKVIRLNLDKFYEDISSTRIRENVDLGRDISDLIDAAAQNYIYDNDLYLRQPAYKHELQARELNIYTYEPGDDTSGTDEEYFIRELGETEGINDTLTEYLSRKDIRKVIIKTPELRLSAAAGAKRIRTSDLIEEFGDIRIASYIRSHCGGEIAVIGALYVSGGENVSYIRQILLTELLSLLAARDYSYAVFHPVCGKAADPLAERILERQGFINISDDPERPVYAVDMRNPIVLFRDADTVIKAPLSKNERVQKAFDSAHYKLLKVLREIYPGRLLLSYNTSAVYSRIIDLATQTNGVKTTADPLRRRGPYLAVPFSKALSDIVVPNTVTKALRTEKYLSNDLKSFDVREIVNYLSLDEQAETIHSFCRPVMLIDDLLHSGQRMEKVASVLRKHGVEIKRVIVGLLTGNARDRMSLAGIDTQCAYFLPSISMWLNERDCYPFIGGDSIDPPKDEEGKWQNGHTRRQESVNLILPYTGLSFIGEGKPENIYRYSLTCLENTADIMRVLEQEYQIAFGKKLTMKRLPAVLTNPRRPLLGGGIDYNDLVAPSVYIDNEIRRLKRMFLFGKYHEN